MRRTQLVAAMCACATLATAHIGRAQETGRAEIGAFARYTVFDGDLDFAGRAGPGARLGVFLTPAIGLEADGALAHTRPKGTSGSNDIDYKTLHGLLTLNLPFSERLTVVTGLGGHMVRFDRGDGSSADTDFGPSLLLGARLHLTRAIALRIDGGTDYTLHPANTDLNTWTLGAQAGLSVLLGRHGAAHLAPNADEDGDGVVNSADRCAGTAPHTAVDGSGCPRRQDSDGDGVSNLDDICPNTPAAATVDANGCSAAQRSGDTTAAAKPDTAAATRADTTAAALPADTAGAAKADTAAADRDGDGIVDTADRCPGTPKGAKVDASGCTGTLDGDGDGVLDDKDKCPKTRPGTKVDASGCPVAPPAPRPKHRGASH